MLSILEILPPEENKTIRDFWHRITTPAVTAVMRSVEGCSYIHIFCRQRKGETDWRMIARNCLDQSDRVLMPRNLQPPQDGIVRRFVPYEFHRRMLENMASDILVCSAVRPELRRVAVYGMEGEINRLLPRMAALAGEIRVITRRAHAVMDTVNELRSRRGAAIGVTESFDAVGFDLLLAPSGGAAMFRLSENTVVLSPDRPSVPVDLWIKSAVPDMPPVLEKIYSEEYDPVEFIGCFYEGADMTMLGRIPARAGVTESGEITPAEAAELISRKAGG